MIDSVRIFVIVLLLLISGADLVGQIVPSQRLGSVTLELDKKAVSGANSASEQIYLRLRNNTPQRIAIDANFDLQQVRATAITLLDGADAMAIQEGALVDLCFDIRMLPVLVKERPRKSSSGLRILSEGYYILKDNPAKEDKRTCLWRGTGSGEHAWLEPSKSVLVSIPRKYVRDDTVVQVFFAYESEFLRGILDEREPRHLAFWMGAELSGPPIQR